MKIVGILGVCLTLLFAAPSCKKDKKEAKDSNRPTAEERKEAAAKLVAPDLLKRVPADAILVFANYQRLDESFVNSIASLAATLRVSYEEKLASEAPEAIGFLEKYGKVLTLAGLKKIGVNTAPFFAIYNHGLSLVLRVELEDGDAFLGFVDKIIAEYGEKDDEFLKPKTMGTMRYWESPPDEAAIVIGVDKKEFVLALMPAKNKGELLPAIFGDKGPAKNITESNTLKEAIANFGGAKGAGYFDLEAAVKAMLDGSLGLADSKLDFSDGSKICKEEFLGMARLMPKIVFGYDRLGTKEISTYLGVELRDDVAATAAEIASTVPGYGYATQSDSMIAIGMGLNSHKLISFFTEASKKIENSPYQCEKFAELNEVLAQAGDKLDLLPPVLADIVGYVLLFDSFDAADPTKSTGLWALQSDDLGPLLLLAQNFLPEGAKVKLEKGAAPVKLKLGELGVPVDVYAARSENMVGFAVGDSKSKLGDLVSSKTPKQGPFLFMRVKLSGPTGLAAVANAEEEAKKTISKEQQAMLDKLDTFRIELEANGKGLMLRSSVTIK